MHLPRLTQFALCLALAACGGGGATNSNAAPTAAPAPAQAPTPTPTPAATPSGVGVYDVNYGQFTGTYVFLDDAQFSGVHFVSGSVLAGHPHGTLSATNSPAKPDPIIWANFIDDLRKTGAYESNPVFGRSFSGSAVDVAISSPMGNFSTRATAQKTWGDGSSRTVYADALPLASLAGKYEGSVRTVGIGEAMTPASAFTIDASGNVAATAGNCQFSGSLRQHGSTGIFDLNWTPSGANCKFTGPLKGLAVPLSINGSALTLALLSDNDDKQQTAVFIVHH